MEFSNVTAQAEANIYFDGKVISHTIITADGERKTLGVILPGEYHSPPRVPPSTFPPTPASPSPSKNPSPTSAPF